MVVEPRQQTIPVERRTELADDVHHVGAVEALALLHEALRPDHLFSGTQADGAIEQLRRGRVREPEIVDARDAIAGAEDDVHEIRTAVDFSEPVRKRQLGAVPDRGEQVEDAPAVCRLDEQVEILRVALDARVLGERERAADQIRDRGLVEPRQRARVERSGRLVDSARGTGAHRELPRVYSGRASGAATTSCGGSVARRPVGVGGGSSTATSKTRNGGRSANVRVSSGIETL